MEHESIRTRPEMLSPIAGLVWPLTLGQAFIFVDLNYNGLDVLPDWIGLVAVSVVGCRFASNVTIRGARRAGFLLGVSSACGLLIKVLGAIGMGSTLASTASFAVVPAYLIGLCLTVQAFANVCESAGYDRLERGWRRLVFVSLCISGLIFLLYAVLTGTWVVGPTGITSIRFPPMIALPALLVVAGVLLASMCLSHATSSARRRPPAVRDDVLRNRGRCPRCGYSFLGLSEPVCPECGTWGLPEAT